MYEQPGGYPPPQQPQYQQPQQPGGGGGGAIALTLKYHWLAFMLGLFKPQVQLNGHPVGNQWGRHVIPVPPGQYHLHVHVPYFLPPQLGPADLNVPVHPGQTVELEYRAPMFAFVKGALGVPPQKYPGAIYTIILMAVLALIVLCSCCAVIVPALNSNSNDLEMIRTFFLQR